MALRTARLRLRRARMDDTAAMHAILGDPAAMRYWSTPPHQDIAETERWMAAMVGALAGESDDFIIERDGEVIGKAGAWRLPEVGFILRPDCWGQGLAHEAMSAVISHLFAAHDLPALTADADPRNTASIALLERLGFHETGRAAGTFEIAGELCDSVYFALPRPGEGRP